MQPAIQRFRIRIGRRSRPLLRLFGVRGPDDAYVDVGPDGIEARFGAARAATTFSNIVGWRIEGPWRWITAIGVRRGLRRGDMSFAGSPRGGVRIDVRDPIRAAGLQTRTLYVGVDDLEGFAAALGGRGIPGEDARLPARPAPRAMP